MTSNDDQALLISPRQWLDCHAGGDVDDDDDDDDDVDDDTKPYSLAPDSGQIVMRVGPHDWQRYALISFQ